jgi:hypothetical protein
VFIVVLLEPFMHGPAFVSRFARGEGRCGRHADND